MLFDTHCHLDTIFDAHHRLLGLENQSDRKQFEENTKKIIKNANRKSIKKILIPAIKPGIVKIKMKNIYLATGSHPYHANETIEKKTKIINALDKAVAIGETGLDFFKCPINKDDQIQSLNFQCKLAIENDLPIILHERNSFDELVSIIKKYPGIKGVFHAFHHSEKELEKIINLDFFVGLGGMVTYKKNNALREAVKNGPIENFLLETDSPYLPPQSKRGMINEPKNLLEIAEYIALLRNTSLKAISLTTTANANRLFNL
tara:strand:+ start:4737 stop:5519 length:783 start_codon:yes stop_codon:yes gene_type:complete